MGDDAVELGEVHRAGIDVEAARTLAEGFDRRIDFQFMHDAEVDKADAARAMRGDLRLGGPTISRVDDIDAVTVRPLFLTTCVSRDDVETIYIDMAAAHLVAGQNLDTARRRHAAQLDPPEACDRGVVEDGALVDGGVEADIVKSGCQRKAEGRRSPAAKVVVASPPSPRKDCPGERLTDGVLAKSPCTTI